MTQIPYYEQWQFMPGKASDWQNEPNERSHPGRRRVAELVKAAGESVLEVACGIGVDYPIYQKEGIRYYGVDVTPKFIEEAQRRGVPCQVADARNLPFPDASFDSVYCKDLFIHLQPGEWRTVLKEMARVAKQQVIILDNGWLTQTVYRPCEKYFFAEGKVLTFYNNMYGEREVRVYAESLGLTVQVQPGGSVKRVVVEGDKVTPDVWHPSQIAVFTKKELQHADC